MNKSAKRFRNVMADLVQALRIANHRVSGRCVQVPFTPEWQTLHDACPIIWRRRRLAAFMRWASEHSIAPAAVDMATLDAFMVDKEQTSLELSAAKLRRSIASSWNTCLEEVASWPKTKLDLAPARTPWTLDWSRFTPEFCRDVDMCIERLAGTDPLDEDGPDKPLRPSTLKWRRFQIRMAASSLVAAGVAVEEIKSLADLVRPERFRMLLRNLLARYGKKTGNIYGLATALKSIARHHCKLDDDEMDSLRRICGKVRYKQSGLTQKSRDRLRPFTDPDTRDRLLLLPQQLMQEALESPQPDCREALIAETARGARDHGGGSAASCQPCCPRDRPPSGLRRQRTPRARRDHHPRGGGEERDRARVPAAAREHPADQALHHQVPAAPSVSRVECICSRAPKVAPSGRTA